MEKKTIYVKKHPRKLKSGKVIKVKKHTRDLEKHDLDEYTKIKIMFDKSKKLNKVFFENLEDNPKLKMNRVLNNIELDYYVTTSSLSLAKEFVNEFRGDNRKSYYFIGSIDKQKVYRVYRSEPYPEPLTKKEIREPGNAEEVIKLQIKEKDWSHLSQKYPNLIGITDKNVEEYMKSREEKWTNYGESKIRDENYIKRIKCYNPDEILTLSEKIGKEYRLKNHDLIYDRKNKFHENGTIYLTSPRGGHEILSDFAYANKLRKENIPYDLYSHENYNDETVLKSRSLPYGRTIDDVNDIVFIDDICMSGEQESSARSHIRNVLKEYKLSSNQMPRIHYIAIVGNKKKFDFKPDGTYEFKYHSGTEEHKKWTSVTIGDMHSFKENEEEKDWEDISGVVFPYSIPDGARHHKIRKLYKLTDRFRHTSSW